jgi:hypothetical protein
MHNVSVQIVRFADGHQPGWVKCALVDADGQTHAFIDKVPIFTAQDLDAASAYPVRGIIQCEVVENFRDECGRDLVQISTKMPDHVESTEGLSEFIVTANLVTTLCGEAQ